VHHQIIIIILSLATYSWILLDTSLIFCSFIVVFAVFINDDALSENKILLATFIQKKKFTYAADLFDWFSLNSPLFRGSSLKFHSIRLLYKM